MPRDSRDPIVETFERLAARDADRILVASPSRHARVGEVAALARSLAGSVDRLEPGAQVALGVGNGPGFLAAWLALRHRGAVPVLVDPSSPAAERRRLAKTLGCSWCLEGRDSFLLKPEGYRLEAVDGVTPVALPPETGAVKLTSGSTGAARGIVAPSEALASAEAALAATMGIDGSDRILTAIPLSHSYGFSSIALAALVRGAMVVLPEAAGGPYGPLAAARALDATVFPTVPSVLDALVRRSRPSVLAPSVRLTLTAGAPLRPETAERFRATQGRGVHVFYGSSETGGITFDREGTAGERGTVGEPVEGVTVELLPVDGEAGADCGRVAVSGPAVTAGYLPAPGPDEPCRLGGGRFLTGDLGRFVGSPTGARELVLAGRTDDLINVAGKKVNPREVEAVLGELDGVLEVVALATAHGDGCRTGPPGPQTRVRVVVAAEPGTLTSDDVVAWCRGRLAEHKVPRSIVLVAELPRTSRGKLDRVALARLAP
jgi:long-chain acyl-CoA synthetase